MSTEIIRGKVIKIINNYQVIVDLGYNNRVKKDMNFIIYDEGELIRDPDTKKILGKLEHVKARIKPIHIQSNFSTMETSQEEITKLSAFMGGPSIKRKKPFLTNQTFKSKDDIELIVKVGDLVRQDIS